MGFKPKRKMYNLKFSGTEFDGLEVLMRSASIGKLLEIQELNASANGGDKVDVAAGSKAFKSMVEMVADVMVSWNVEEDDGTPVPSTFDGIMTQDSPLIMAVITAWSEATSGVSAPLAPGSTSGESALEASIPMETLPLSLVS